EADTRLNPCQEHIQACCFADVAFAPSMPFETHTGWCVVRQQDIHVVRVGKPFDFVERVVSLRVALKLVRATFVVRGTIAAADASNSNGPGTLISDINPTSVANITQAREHLEIRTRIEPREVFVIALDEEGRPWRPSVVFQPCREVARPIMVASRLIDP